MGMVTAPVTDIVMSWLTASMVTVTLAQEFSGRACAESMCMSWSSLPSYRADRASVGHHVASQSQTPGSLPPAVPISVPVAVRWMILRQPVPSAVGISSKATVY